MLQTLLFGSSAPLDIDVSREPGGLLPSTGLLFDSPFLLSSAVAAGSLADQPNFSGFTSSGNFAEIPWNLPSFGTTPTALSPLDPLTGLTEGIPLAGVEELTADLIETSSHAAVTQLRQFAASHDFIAQLQLAFGEEIDLDAANRLQQQWLAADLTSTPEIAVWSAAELQGAAGGFAAANNAIYLAQEYLTQNLSNPTAISGVLLEELGHFVDAQINIVDAPGDEGAIFAALVQGQELSPDVLTALRAEDDTVIAVVDGALVKIEQANLGDLPDSGVINVKTQYGAKGDGVTDDTAAIQRALTENSGKNKIVYLPEGTYLVSDTLAWAKPYKRLTLEGESREGTTIKLKDRAAGFGNPSDSKPVITTFTGNSTGQAFRNQIYDLTIDVGTGNAGAVGIQFTSNNQGGIRNVAIRSSDPQGAGFAGVNFNKQWPGPSLIKDVTVEGFDYGIRIGYFEYGLVFENLTLKNQNLYGLRNYQNAVSIRNFTSINAVPAIYNQAAGGLVNVLNGRFTGGIASNDAIDNPNSDAKVYLRNVTTSGYRSALRDDRRIFTNSTISEYASGPTYSLFPSPAQSLHLAMRETPTITYDRLSDWVNVADYGAQPNDNQDDTRAIQQAIDSGLSTVYFPSGAYNISDTVQVRGNVKMLAGLESTIKVGNPLLKQSKPAFRFETGTQDVVAFERFFMDYVPASASFHWFEHASKNTVVLRNTTVGSGKTYRNTGSGDLFIEDVAGGDWIFNRQNVWARQLNPENVGTKITNNGGSLWILGLKTEKTGTVIKTAKSGKTEVLGGLLYPVQPIPSDQPAFINDESSLSVSIAGSSYSSREAYDILIQEKREGATRNLYRSLLPVRAQRGFILPLYAGHR